MNLPFICRICDSVTGLKDALVFCAVCDIYWGESPEALNDTLENPAFKKVFAKMSAPPVKADLDRRDFMLFGGFAFAFYIAVILLT